jgi:glycosyltransferase involved in cell wall biosynthesis
MKILLLIEGTYPWYRGGVSEWVYQYLKNLPAFRFTVVQIATDEFQGLDPADALYPLTPNIEKFVRISPPKFAGVEEAYLQEWFSAISQKLATAGDNFDLLHVTNTGFAGWLGSKLAALHNVPLLLTEHAIYWKEVEMGAVALECGYKIPETSSLKKSVVSAFQQFATTTYHAADKIVSVSASNLPYQKQLGARKVDYIPNGIPKHWLLMEQRQREKQPVIAWVGRCAEMKNPLAFFDYVDSFRNHEINPEFTMLLSDANEQDLEQKVRQRSKEYPEVTCIWNEPAKPYFSTFDFLLITSHNESQPLVMLEALAHRVLPVGYAVGDLTEKYGLVFEPGRSIDEITSSIENIWSRPYEFSQSVDKKFHLVQENHTWEHIFSQYRRLMKTMINKEHCT